MARNCRMFTNIKGRISGYVHDKILRYMRLTKRWKIRSIDIVTKNGNPKDGLRRTKYLIKKSGLNIRILGRNDFFLDMEKNRIG